MLDEDGVRAIVAGRIPDYLRWQCEDFLVEIDRGPAAGGRVMDRNAAAQRAADAAAATTAATKGRRR